MKCPTCSAPMLALFLSQVCDFCEPPPGVEPSKPILRKGALKGWIDTEGEALERNPCKKYVYDMRIARNRKVFEGYQEVYLSSSDASTLHYDDKDRSIKVFVSEGPPQGLVYG